MAAFKNRIRELRKEKEMSQQQLADQIGVNKQTISQYERGVREPQFENLLALCDVFNVSTDYLLGRSDITMRLLNSEELSLINSYRKNGALSPDPVSTLSPLALDVARAFDRADPVRQEVVCDTLHINPPKEKEGEGIA